MPVVPTLEVSTAHLPDTERDLLEQVDENTASFPVRVIQHTYGWLVPVPDDGDTLDDAYRTLLRDGAPAFALLLTYAAGTGARFIYLDADADTHPGLPTYDEDATDTDLGISTGRPVQHAMSDYVRILLGKDLVHRNGQVEVDPGNWRTIITAVIDTDGSLGGDPGDIVVAFDGDSRAYAPNQPVRWQPSPNS